MDEVLLAALAPLAMRALEDSPTEEAKRVLEILRSQTNAGSKSNTDGDGPSWR